MTIDIEKLAKDAGAYSTDTAKEVYLQNDEYIFIKNSLVNFADAYTAKSLEDKACEIAELKEIIESIAELYSAAVEQIMRLQNDCL